MEITQGISDFLGGQSSELASDIVLMLSGIAAVGLLSMAIWEVLKSVLRLRRWFFQYRIQEFLLAGEYKVNKSQSESDAQSKVIRVERFIGEMLGFSSLHLLYSLTLDEIIAKLRSVNYMSLEWSDEKQFKHKVDRFDLLSIFTSDDSRVEWYRDAVAVQEVSPQEVSPQEVSPQEVSPQEVTAQEVDRIRKSLGVIIEGKLEGLRVSTKYWWTLLQQTAVQTISFLLIYSFLSGFFSSASYLLAYSIVGGLIAPFAHDWIGSFKKVS